MIKTTLLALALQCPPVTPDQAEVLEFAKEYGKPNYSLTLAAIAWVESKAGEQLVSPSNDFGVFQNNLETMKRRTDKGEEYLKSRLVKDITYSAKYAMEELKYWEAQRATRKDVIRSYNAGWAMGSEDYWNKFKKALHIVQYCV